MLFDVHIAWSCLLQIAAVEIVIHLHKDDVTGAEQALGNATG